jgi:hypothetical protein
MRFRNEANRISSSATVERYLTPARLQRQQLSSRTSVDLDLEKKTLNAVECCNNQKTITIHLILEMFKLRNFSTREIM